MIFTNKYNLDEIICRYLASDDYDYEPGVISATTLLKPARAVVLNKIHAEELTIDYSDLFSRQNGTAIHAAIERLGILNDGDFQEKRFYTEFMGYRISGKVDMVIGATLMDIKTTKTWKYVFRDFDDYVKQLSVYRWIMARNHIMVTDTGYIHMFFTDWQPKEARRNPDYPQIPYVKQRIELMSLEDTEKFIEARLTEFVFAESALPDCTKEELWTRDEAWAIYAKAGGTRAKKLCKSEAEAKQYVAENGGVIEHRPGKAVRCGYCTAAPFCDQYRKLKEAGLIDD